MKKLSAVIACYRDAPAIPEMYERLTETFRSLGVDYEIIFVNDASPDNAREVLAELAASDPRVVVVNHTRNFGSQSAFTSGLRIATGDAAILLDGDLQDPPELIAEFHEKWLEGWDVVYGVRVRRVTTVPMRVAYKLFYRLFRATAYVSVPLDAGDFSLLDRRVVDALNGLPESDRFMRGLRAWVGFRQTGVPYVRPERPYGTSTNSLVGNFKWARRAVLSFSYAPLDLIAWLAFVTVGVSIVAATVQIVLRFVDPSLAPRGIHVAPARDVLPRRDPAPLPCDHRVVSRSHLRRGQAATAVHRRQHPQPPRGVNERPRTATTTARLELQDDVERRATANVEGRR